MPMADYVNGEQFWPKYALLAACKTLRVLREASDLHQAKLARGATHHKVSCRPLVVTCQSIDIRGLDRRAVAHDEDFRQLNVGFGNERSDISVEIARTPTANIELRAPQRI
jgi:hypothetical protein